MKKVFSKVMSTILATAMLMGAVTATPVMAASSMTNVGGWNESLYAEWTDSKPTAATVEYKLSSEGNYTALAGDDKAYLQRTKSGSTARVDIVGLTPGTYDLRITASDGTILTQTGIVVDEYDRSGYAHFNYKEGVGAYNDDGTIKDKAKVLYVTDANKDTVTVSSSDGTTVTGIGNILNSRGYADNGNNGILKKLSEDGTPLVVRFIGAVTAPKGLTAYDSTAFGGSVGDNGYMARMQSATNLTLEGIGYDAQIEGWGVHFIAETATSALGFGKSFEVRNITFDGSPEDAIGMEGQGDTTLTAPVERCWIHHCSFLPPKVSNPAESDKDGGDGACDFKRGMYFTNSYCYYENYHKTNLVGASDKNQQYNLTYHHNYWNKCESRGPLGRQANIHMYNNYFNGQTSYAMNTRANCYIFSEYNALNKCKNPMRVDSGAIKSYKDNLISCSGEMGGTFVTSKSTKVSSGNKYENFDTDASLSYIPGGNYKLTESAGEAMAECIAYSGPMKEVIMKPGEVDTSIISNENKPANFVSLPYEGTFTKDYVTSTGRQVIDNIVFNATKVATDSITIKGEGVVFKVNTTVDVTMSGLSGSYSPVLYGDDGTEYIVTSGSATLPAGTYVIQSSGYDAGSQSFKEAKVTGLKITVNDPNAPTVTETSTETTTADPDVTTTEGTTSEGTTTEGDTEETTIQITPSDGEGYIWNYTDGTNTGNFYSIDANDWSSAVPVTYNGATLTEAIKMESSSNISFTTAKNSVFTVVSYSTASAPKIKIDGTSYDISANGATTINLTAGAHSITKDTSSTYLYYMQVVEEGSQTSSETTTETPTETTTITETTTQTTTEAPTETTTAAPVSDGLSMNEVNAVMGSDVEVPIIMNGVSDSIATYTITVGYDSSVFTVAGVANGDVLTGDNVEFMYYDNGAGKVVITAINPDNLASAGNKLCILNLTPVKVGASELTLTVDEFVNINGENVTIIAKGTLTNTTNSGILGDVNGDGSVNVTDATMVAKYALGALALTDEQLVLADVNNDGNVNVTDAANIAKMAIGA